VGAPFAATLNVTGDGVTQSVEAYYGNYFTMEIIRGSLPPGLQLTLPDSEWTITGTPTKADTYPLTERSGRRGTVSARRRCEAGDCRSRRGRSGPRPASRRL
jgi:hypothetical protein